jgi:hypothetical protein
MPIINYDSLDAVPPDLRDFAKAIDGQEGKMSVNVIPASKLDSFRDNNIALSKERDTLKEELGILKPIFGEKTPEEFVKDLEDFKVTAQRVKDGELKEGRQIEEATLKRTEELRKTLEERIQKEALEKAAWVRRHDEVLNRYKTSQVASYIKDACMDAASGVNPKAISEIVDVSLRTFRADDQGRITPFDGDATVYGADGSSPMTGIEWLQKLKEAKPFFFMQTQGGGAGGGILDKKVHGKTLQELKKLSGADLLALANSGQK